MTDTTTFLLLMIPGTLFLGINDVLVRRTLRNGKSSSQFLLIYEFGLVALILSISLLFTGIPEIHAGFWSAAAITIVLNTFAQWAWYSAFAREEASLISPFRLITPPLVIFTGYLILHETPSFAGALGILITIIGLWLLLQGEAKERRFSLGDILRRKGVLLALWGAVSFAISLPFDKKTVVTSSSIFAVVVVFAGLALGSAIIFLLRRGGQGARLDFQGNRRVLLLLPFVHTAASLLTYAALQYSLVAYAASVKRLWSLWAVLFSGAFLREGNIRRKLFATVIMLIGVLVTAFGG